MQASWMLVCKNSDISYTATPPKSVRWGYHKSPFEPLMVGLTDDGAVCRIEFTRKRNAVAILKAWEREWPQTEFVHDEAGTEKIIKRLIATSTKAANANKFKLQMTGTKFQQAVWKALTEIPLGEVKSYADIAREIKSPRAARAVGTACGANPVPILVPCHRVVASNGGLGGFGGGLELKRKLLKAEGTRYE